MESVPLEYPESWENWNKLANSMFKTYIKMNMNGRYYDAQAQILWCYALAGVSAQCVNFGFLSQSNNNDRKAHIVGQYGY